MSSDAHVYGYVERPDVVAALPNGINRLLDVGGSRGGFAVSLRVARAAKEIWGIEADPTVEDEAAPRYDRYIRGTYPDALPDEQFDCIAFNDVLEHLVDPWSVLRTTHKHLAPGGIVVASIPNVRFLPVVARLALAGDFTYTDTGVMDRTHLRFFTRKTMVDLFESSGYKVIKVVPSNPWRGMEWIAKLSPRQLRDAVYRQFIIVAGG